mgnify:CR=1 FL=1
MPKLRVTTSIWREAPPERGEVAEISFDGFIDAANYAKFEEALEKAHQADIRSLILDFRNVHYINSTGISAVVRYYELFKERGGVLCLANVTKPVGLSMHLLGVTSFVPFLKDVAAAREHVARHPPESSAVPHEVAEGSERGPGAVGEWEEEGGPALVIPGVDLAHPPLRIPVWRRKAPRLEKARVLFVTPLKGRFARILRLRFQGLDGEYELLHDVKEALDRYDELVPDLVILDGRADPAGEFVNRLKIQKERSLTSVIKFYEKEADLDRQLDFKIWENDYLVEPFEILELFSLAEAELVRVPKDRKVLQQQLSFEFRTTPQNVEKACKLVDLVLRQSVATQEDGTAMYAAVKEGIDNAVLHGNRWDPAKTVDVNILVDKKKVTVIVEDQGEGFDFDYYLRRLDDTEAFEKAKRRILEEGIRGGLGILLMYKCTDRLEYSGAGNILRLEKNI